MPESKLRRSAGVSEAGARCRNPERSEGPLRRRDYSVCHVERGRMPESKLRRSAGVSEAGARCRNPERSEGPLRRRDYSVCHVERGRMPESKHPCADGSTIPLKGVSAEQRWGVSKKLPDSVVASGSDAGVLRLRLLIRERISRLRSG